MRLTALLLLVIAMPTPAALSKNPEVACRNLNYADFTGRTAFRAVSNIPTEAEAAVRQSQSARLQISRWIETTAVEVQNYAEARRQAAGDPAKLKVINAEYLDFTKIYDATRGQIIANAKAYLDNLAAHLPKQQGRDFNLAAQERTSLIHIVNNLEDARSEPGSYRLQIADSWASRPTLPGR